MNFKPLAYILLATSSLTACTMAPVKEQKIEPFVLRNQSLHLHFMHYWHSFELDPDAPAKHDTSNTERLAKKYGRTYEEMEEMERNIAAMAASEGIDFQWQKPTQAIALMHTVLSTLHKVKV